MTIKIPVEAVNKKAYQFIDITDQRWMDFINRNQCATIFHHPAWIKVIGDYYGFRSFIVAFFDKHNRLIAGLPMVNISSLFRRDRMISLPFTDYCNPLFEDSEALQQLISQLDCIYYDMKLKKFEIRWQLPDLPNFYKQDGHFFHYIDLVPDFNQVAQNFSKMHRRNSLKAQKNGVTVEWGTGISHIRTFFNLHVQTRKRLGVPVQPAGFFDFLHEFVIKKGLGFVLLAHHGKKCLAGAVFLHWQKTLTYKYGASISDGLPLRPNNLLFWEAISWGCRNGYSIFDMGKTEADNYGLRSFKMGWGAIEKELNYSILSDNPPIKGMNRMLLWGGKVIQKSPPWVCRLLGELLYKHVP